MLKFDGCYTGDLIAVAFECLLQCYCSLCKVVTKFRALSVEQLKYQLAEVASQLI